MSTHNICFYGQLRKICLFLGKKKASYLELLYVCVEVLWPSQPNGVMSNTVSLSIGINE